MVLVSIMSPQDAAFGIGFAIAIPLVYGLMGFIFTLIGCALYNIIAGWIGGIEMELD